jgi:hypothetical protein
MNELISIDQALLMEAFTITISTRIQVGHRKHHHVLFSISIMSNEAMDTVCNVSHKFLSPYIVVASQIKDKKNMIIR